MNTRKLIPYGENGEILYAFALIKEMIIEIDALMTDYVVSAEEAEKLNTLKQKCQNILEKYETVYSVQKKINQELLSPENVEYSMKHKKFPPHPSKTFDAVEEALQECFELEADLAETVVARIWQEETEKEVDYQKGESFYNVVHSGHMGEIVLPGSPNYRDSYWTNTSFFSCSLLTAKHLDMYNSQIGIEFYVDKESLVCASQRDCATRESDYQNIRTIKRINSVSNTGENTSKYIQAGHSFGDIVATRLLTPKAIERDCVLRAKQQYGGILEIDEEEYQAEVKIINEVVLDKSSIKPKSVFLKTNGCEFLFWEYLYASEMAKTYGIPIKIINTSIYRKKEGVTPFTEEEKEDFHSQLVKYLNAKDGYETVTRKNELGQPFECRISVLPIEKSKHIIEFLEGYKRDILEKAGYDKKIKLNMEKAIDGMLECAREKEQQAQMKKKGKKPIEHDN